MDETTRESFLAAARIAGDLVRRPEVTARWADESACAGMSVGGLACHLGSQVTNTVRLVGSPDRGEAPIPLLEHYVRAAWVGSDLDADVNVGIRDASNADAADGPDALAALVDDQLARLPGVLAAADASSPLLIPWQGWSLTVTDWLVTRMMEIVVHSDDLAASVDVETPEFPGGVVTPVLALLTGVATRRHGQTAVVRALSRPQRAPSSVSAF
jgi:mycothiol maleylpyruvate isomerase-like protein